MVSKAEKRAARRAQAQAAAPAPQAEQPKTEQAAKPTRKPTGTIKVLKDDPTFRGARKAWFERLKEFNGKDVGEFEADCKANPPSTPTKGVLAGKCEPPSGWVGYFRRTGICSIVPPGKTE